MKYHLWTIGLIVATVGCVALFAAFPWVLQWLLVGLACVVAYGCAYGAVRGDQTSDTRGV